MTDEIDTLARKIWDYHHLNRQPKACEMIFTLCSIDTRVAEYAAELFLQGFGHYLIFSGGMAHGDDLLKTAWEGSEAEHFANVAKSKGVPANRILIEDKAQNTGQNIQFTYQLLSDRKMHPESLLLVQKPYMERRTYATFKKQWPDPNTLFIVTSPPIPYDEYFNDSNPKNMIINIMVGDLQRIKTYPALGFQIEQDIPDDVWQAYERLLELGYNAHTQR